MRHSFLCADVMAIALTFLLGTDAALAAEPLISIKHARGHGIFTQGQIPGGMAAPLTVAAFGSAVFDYEVAATVGGVIFQAEAVPRGDAMGKSVALDYDPRKADCERLMVGIDSDRFPTRLCDWQLIPIALFVDSGYTSAMSLLDDPRSDAEQSFAEKERDPDFPLSAVMWTSFHPALKNTLIGMNLFFVDAMFVDADPAKMRRITTDLDPPVPGYGDGVAFSDEKSRIAMQIIRTILDASYWDSYIYTDVGEDFFYQVVSNQLVLSGDAHYNFLELNDDSKTVQRNDTVTTLLKWQPRLLEDLNPEVYRLAATTARWGAFFRHCRRVNDANWHQFVASVATLEFDPTIDTPRAFRR